MNCVHCGIGLAGDIGGGLFTHENNLQRCQRGAPYGHMGHPTMPCPGTPEDPNPCQGYRERDCDHIAQVSDELEEPADA